MNPNTEKTPLSKLLPGNNQRLKIGFIYEKTATSSAWTYSHELGRLHLEQTFPEEVKTRYYDNVTVSTVEEYIEKAIRSGCNIVCTTTPAFVQASVKAAIAHPTIRILNCSLNTSHRYIRTYYARMHEAKFLMGAAGAKAENVINLFILKIIRLLWFHCKYQRFCTRGKDDQSKGKSLSGVVKQEGYGYTGEDGENRTDHISGKDMVIPEEGSRHFGVFSMVDGQPRNLWRCRFGTGENFMNS